MSPPLFPASSLLLPWSYFNQPANGLDLLGRNAKNKKVGNKNMNRQPGSIGSIMGSIKEAEPCRAD